MAQTVDDGATVHVQILNIKLTKRLQMESNNALCCTQHTDYILTENITYHLGCLSTISRDKTNNKHPHNPHSRKRADEAGSRDSHCK